MHLSGATIILRSPRRRSGTCHGQNSLCLYVALTRAFPTARHSARIEDGDGQRQLGYGINSGKPYRGLSDELILKIYHQVYAAGHSNGTLPGLREILVSERIYKVARPAYLHTIRVSWSRLRTDEVIAGLLCDEQASALVRALDITVFASLENTTAAMLARLPNLQALTLSFDYSLWRTKVDLYPLSAFFIRQLARLPPLRHLDLPNPVSFQADLSVSSPRIQRVTTSVHSIKPAFSAFLCRSGVEKLVLSQDHLPPGLHEVADLP